MTFGFLYQSPSEIHYRLPDGSVAVFRDGLTLAEKMALLYEDNAPELSREAMHWLAIINQNEQDRRAVDPSYVPRVFTEIPLSVVKAVTFVLKCWQGSKPDATELAHLFMAYPMLMGEMDAVASQVAGLSAPSGLRGGAKDWNDTYSLIRDASKAEDEKRRLELLTQAAGIAKASLATFGVSVESDFAEGRDEALEKLAGNSPEAGTSAG
ncbi:MAG: hypothetical protein ABFD60_04180 [Bryobacteraceae bacterium]